MKPCLHINTSDMEPEPLPIILSREHGVEWCWIPGHVSIYISSVSFKSDQVRNRRACRFISNHGETVPGKPRGAMLRSGWFPGEHVQRLSTSVEGCKLLFLKAIHQENKNRISLKGIYNQWSSLGILSGPWTRGHRPNPMSPTIQQSFQVYPGQRGGWSRARTYMLEG